MSSRLMTQLLGYAGLLPFFGFCFGFATLEDWPRSLSIQGFVIYSLAIFCFFFFALLEQEQQAQCPSAFSAMMSSNE